MRNMSVIEAYDRLNDAIQNALQEAGVPDGVGQLEGFVPVPGTVSRSGDPILMAFSKEAVGRSALTVIELHPPWGEISDYMVVPHRVEPVGDDEVTLDAVWTRLKPDQVMGKPLTDHLPLALDRTLVRRVANEHAPKILGRLAAMIDYSFEPIQS